MRVMSWNLWWRFGGNWRRRQDGIVSTLRDLRPDVAGLQEVWGGDGTTQAQVLADRLGMHAGFAAPSLPPPPRPPEAPDQDGIEVGVAVLSRWPILGVRRHRLPSAHRAQQPVALLASLDHPAGPLHVMVSCIEWEPEYANDQLAQARVLAELLLDPALDGPLPVLLAADLNAPPGSPEVRALTDVAVDTWVAGEGDPAGVTLSARNPFAPREAWRQIDQRIDYVLARPGSAGQALAVGQAFAVDVSVDGLPPSDHYAVVADLLV